MTQRLLLFVRHWLLAHTGQAYRCSSTLRSLPSQVTAAVSSAPGRAGDRQTTIIEREPLDTGAEPKAEAELL